MRDFKILSVLAMTVMTGAICTNTALAQVGQPEIRVEGFVLRTVMSDGKEQQQSIVFGEGRGRMEVISGSDKGSVTLLDFASRKNFLIDREAETTLLEDFPATLLSAGPAAELSVNDTQITYKPVGAVENIMGLMVEKYTLEVGDVQCGSVYTSRDLASFRPYVAYFKEYLGKVPTTRTASGSDFSEADAEVCSAAATEPVRAIAQFGLPVLVEDNNGKVLFEVKQRIPASFIPANMFMLPDYPVEIAAID